MTRKLQAAERNKFNKSKRGNQLVRRESAKADSGIQKINAGSVTWQRSEVAAAELSSKPEESQTKHPAKAWREIKVGGHTFKVSKNGKSFKRVQAVPAASSPGQKVSSPRTTLIKRAPSKTVINGRTFVSKGNMLVRDASNTKKALANRTTKRSLRYVRKKEKKSKQHCMFFCKFGKCAKLNEGTCPFVHDKSKVAVCRKFLRGECYDDECLLSHVVAPEKMPVCKHFLGGNCNRENCPYSHVKVSATAGICKAFLKGFCPDGSDCKLQHVLICKAFLAGKCKNGSQCQLHHPKEIKDKKRAPDDAEIQPLVLQDACQVTEEAEAQVSITTEEQDVPTVADNTTKEQELPKSPPPLSPAGVSYHMLLHLRKCR